MVPAAAVYLPRYHAELHVYLGVAGLAGLEI